MKTSDFSHVRMLSLPFVCIASISLDIAGVITRHLQNICRSFCKLLVTVIDRVGDSLSPRSRALRVVLSAASNSAPPQDSGGWSELKWGFAILGNCREPPLPGDAVPTPRALPRGSWHPRRGDPPVDKSVAIIRSLNPVRSPTSAAVSPH